MEMNTFGNLSGFSSSGFSSTASTGSVGVGGEPPCPHNNWDNLRVKKGIVTLGCRDCMSRWKLPHPLSNLCPDFYDVSCPFGPHCPLLHVHRFKSRLKSPDHPAHVSGTPQDPLFRTCVVQVLSGRPLGTRPSEVYSEVLALYTNSKNGTNNSGANSLGGEMLPAQPQTMPMSQVLSSASFHQHLQAPQMMQSAPQQFVLLSQPQQFQVQPQTQMMGMPFVVFPSSFVQSRTAAVPVNGAVPCNGQTMPFQFHPTSGQSGMRL